MKERLKMQIYKAVNKYIALLAVSETIICENTTCKEINDFIDELTADINKVIDDCFSEHKAEYRVHSKPDKVFKTPDERDAYIYGYGDGHGDGYEDATNEALRIIKNADEECQSYLLKFEKICKDLGYESED